MPTSPKGGRCPFHLDPLPPFQFPQRQRPLSLKFFTIAGNHISIPIKAVFRYPAQVFFIGLVTVNVYKAIAFLIPIQPAQDIGKRPRAVTQQLHAIADRLLASFKACRYTEMSASPSSRNKRMVSAAI
ncbi:hypothetical protein SAMN05446927_0562 [Caballeronia arationis]|uniref:Uncharacterized protein n=1 Tax=Caballeronia arationis TaxID=1777142 RepID=A0A7Z7I1N5_9BURK|nr:hypothetical protein SAMN05446927_0562 [Caballeronia arationis]